MGTDVSSPLSFMNWTLHVLASYNHDCSMTRIALIYILSIFPRNLSYKDRGKKNIFLQLLLFSDKNNRVTVQW